MTTRPLFFSSNFPSWLPLNKMRMRSSLVVRASDCLCTSCNGPGFDPSIRRHSGIWGAADEAVLNIVRTKKRKKKYKNKRKRHRMKCVYKATKPIGASRISLVLRIHDILVWIWIQIQIRESMPLTNGSGSCFFHHWPSRRQQKTNLKKGFLHITF